MRNVECQKTFLEYTNESQMLTKCLINQDIRTGGKMWITNLKYVIFQTFRKIRLNRKDKLQINIEALVKQRFTDTNIDQSAIDQEIASQIFERNRKLIIEQVSEMSDVTCSLSRIKMWKVKQKVCPSVETACPVAKIDSNGDLISNTE